MKPGDILTTSNNRKYVLFSIDNDFLYVVDFETQNIPELLTKELVKEVESPTNVEFMFIKKREKNIKKLGLDKFK